MTEERTPAASLTLVMVRRQWLLMEGDTVMALFSSPAQAARFCNLFALASSTKPGEVVALSIELPEPIYKRLAAIRNRRTE